MARHVGRGLRRWAMTLPTWGQFRHIGRGQSQSLFLSVLAIALGLFGLIDPPNGRLGPAFVLLAGTAVLVLTLMTIADNEDDAETLPLRRTPQEKALDEPRTGDSPLRRS